MGDWRGRDTGGPESAPFSAWSSIQRCGGWMTDAKLPAGWQDLGWMMGIGLRSLGHLSPVFKNYLCALTSSFRHFFTFLYTLLILLMQKKRYLVPMYLCIWPFEFLKYHDKVNRALERGV